MVCCHLIIRNTEHKVMSDDTYIFIFIDYRPLSTNSTDPSVNISHSHHRPLSREPPPQHRPLSKYTPSTELLVQTTSPISDFSMGETLTFLSSLCNAPGTDHSDSDHVSTSTEHHCDPSWKHCRKMGKDSRNVISLFAALAARTLTAYYPRK